MFYVCLCICMKYFNLYLGGQSPLVGRPCLPSCHIWQLMLTKSRLSPFANTRKKKERRDIGDLFELELAFRKDFGEVASTSNEEEYRNKIKPGKNQRGVDESMEMKMLEDGIKLWSCGKERNIELLLCTLLILWPNSGWCPIPPTNLYESSNVKKAYQRARLHLHPDKLHQRGATLSQKNIAERIFLILQVTTVLLVGKSNLGAECHFCKNLLLVNVQ